MNKLESAYGACSCDVLREWDPPQGVGDGCHRAVLSNFVRMVTCLTSLRTSSVRGVKVLFRLPKSRDMRRSARIWMGGCGLWTRLVMILLTGLLTLVGDGCLLVSLILGVCALLPARSGTLSFLAVAPVVVNDHGGSAPRPTVSFRGARRKRRRVLQAVRDFAWVPCPPDLWRHASVGWPGVHVGDADVASWPYSVGMLVKLCAFLGSFIWPGVVEGLGPSGVSYVKMLILCERWVKEQLVLEPAVPRSRRGGRPISVSAVSGWTGHRYLALL